MMDSAKAVEDQKSAATIFGGARTNEKEWRRFPLFLGAAFLLIFPFAGAGAAGEPILLNPDGAWCWFQDERAVIYDGKMTVASITRSGDVQATTWDFAKGSIFVKTLRPDFTGDDHNVAALLVRRDGRLVAFYAKHHREPRMYYRVTTRPRDATDWEPEQSYDAGVTSMFTYANPFQLPAEENRIYNFWRGIDFNPTWSASDDNGRSWSDGANHIYFKKGERPYVKYASNNVDTIHFAFTEAHPDRPIQTSLYHAFHRKGSLYTSEGKVVRKLSDGPITPSEATKIYDGKNSPTGEAWVWDMALDSSGNPVIAYTSHLSPNDIRYRYARWTGSAWRDRQIAFGGTRLYRSQEFYAGGICLDPDNPDVVYLSSDVNLHDGKPHRSGHYEIYKGVSRDGGKSWEWLPVTAGSGQDNLRPIVPANHPGDTFVLWFRGTYRSYVDYDTEVVAYTDAKLPPVTKRVSPDAETR